MFQVIRPNDLRNDLYVTLVGGEFNKGSSDRNIEVTVTAHDDVGAIINVSSILHLSNRNWK